MITAMYKIHRPLCLKIHKLQKLNNDWTTALLDSLEVGEGDSSVLLQRLEDNIQQLIDYGPKGKDRK